MSEQISLEELVRMPRKYIFGQYRLEEQIGETEKSLVFRANDLRLDRVVALKILKPNQGPERVTQFLEEGKRLAGIKEHRNVVSVYSADEGYGLNYIAMKYVKGPELKQSIDADREFSSEETLTIMEDICNGLCSLPKNIQHEDIKPANIRISEDESEKTYLVDLGGTLSKNTQSDISAIGSIARTLLETGDKTKVPSALENLVARIERGYYQCPEEVIEAIKWYKGIPRRKMIIRGAVGLAGALGLGYAGNSYYNHRRELERKKRDYEISIDSTLDRLKETDANSNSALILFKELTHKLFYQRIKKVAYEENLSKVEEGIEILNMPYDISRNGREWTTSNGTHWSDGFWPAILWLAYDETKDPEFKELASKWTDEIKPGKYDYCSISPIRDYYAHAMCHDVLGDSESRRKAKSRRKALEATNLISRRFNTKGNYLQLSGRINDSEVQEIDMGTLTSTIPLFAWAYYQSDDHDFREIARLHCDATLRYNINRDGSVVQRVEFNSKTGERLGGKVYQGFSDESCLARSQARAIEGFCIASEFLDPEKYLEVAERCARYFMENLSSDRVPYYDFKDPNKKIPKDSSAGAMGALGLLHLARITKKPEYRFKALEILKSLSIDYLSRDEDYQGLLLHGCPNIHMGGMCDVSSIYGDYFYLRNLTEI